MFIRYGSRIWVVAAAFLLAVSVGRTEQADAAQSIEHVRNLRQLTSSDAAQGRPVRIRGVVTALSGWKNSFFLEESGYGISVDRTDHAEVHAGDAVEVTGKSGSGLFAPVIIASGVKVIGQGAVPTAKRTAYTELAGGQGDSQWVEVRGVVHSATISESWGRQVLFLDIDTGDGRIVARVHDFPRRDFSTLVDATVRAVGVCGTNFNDKRQFAGLRLFVPDLSYVRTEETSPRDPFAISETAIGNLFRFGLPQSLRHRVKISGVVTYQEPGSLIYLQSGNEAIAIETSNPQHFESGTRLEAVGFVELGEYSPQLRDATVRKIGRGVPPVATPTALSNIIQLKDGFTFAPYDGLFIQLEAELVSKVESGEQQMLLLRDGNKVFQARIGEAAKGFRAIDARVGSRLKLRGICVIEANQNHEPRSFHLLLRSPQDVSVLRAPWWNIRNSLWLIAFLVLVCLALLLWSVQLRRTFIRYVPDAVSGVCDVGSRFLSFSQWAGLAGAGVGLAVLIGGWGCHIEMLKSILPGRVTMKPNTAAAVVFFGAATWLSARGMRARAQYVLMLACSGFGAAIGFLTLIEYAFGLDLHMDQLLFRDAVTTSALFPGRMALPTAVSFALMGSGAVLLRWRSALLGQSLLLIAGVMHLLNAVGYLYGVTNYFGMASQQGMALQTSLVCLLLCCALLWSNPNGGLMKVIASNAPGGIMAKRLLPAALVIPAVFGWLRWEGQVKGLYDTSFGLALFVSATIVVFSLLIWANAWLLNRLDVERSQAENGLRESEARYRMVLESLPQMVWTCSSDGQSEYLSGQWISYTGISEADQIGYGWMKQIHPADRARFEELWHRAVEAGESLDAEYRICNSAGEYRWFRALAVPFRDPKGTIRRWFGTSTDIEDVKRAEAEIRGFNEALEKRVLERTAQLRESEERLTEQTRKAEEANRAKSDFLAVISHEIRTPMNAILGMAEVLRESQLDSDQRQYVEVFHRAGANLMTLINDILDLSKIEAGQLELECVPFSLEETVEEAVEVAAAKARAKAIELIVDFPPGMGSTLTGDPTRLRQVLINLLGNAVKFTDHGQVVLSVRQHASGEGRIDFAVSDTGIGIAADKLETIFDDFTQADSSITRRYGGTGLGLGISRRLVGLMGGQLTVTSAAGEGSTFRFTASFEPCLVDEKQGTEAMDFHGRRVLVIDDNSTNRLILRDMLSAWGFRTVECGTPGEGLRALADARAGEERYALVLVDKRMPEMDGFETAAKIRELLPAMPIVMLTSDTQRGDISRGRELGLAGYAMKPVRRSELLRLICEAMKIPKCAELSAAQGPASEQLEESVPTTPLKILIAEDSPDNRLLIEIYLKGTPHTVRFTEDGKAALERFEKEPFDLILMDMQMPIMDGLTATRSIRAMERERNLPGIPIVALTANARQDDIEMSRNAGCDAHLSKPISKQRLLAAIEEYARASQKETHGTSPEAIEITIPEGLEEIVPAYLASRKSELPALAEYLAAHDFEQIRALAHNLKGTGASYGFAELTNLGASLENSAKEHDCITLTEHLTALKDYLQRVRIHTLAPVSS